MKGRNILISIVLLTSIMITSIVYAAFNTQLNIEGEVIVRSEQDIRISNISIQSQTNGAYETYNNKYNKDTTFMYVTLPSNSSITYEVDITNKVSYSYLIESITEQSHTNSNVNVDVSLNVNDIVNSNSTKTFTITLTNNTTTEQQETLVYKSQFKENKFIVTFDANGGQVSTSSKEVNYGSKYGDLPTPTRRGYTFKGWYNNSIFDTTIDAIEHNYNFRRIFKMVPGSTYTIYIGNANLLSGNASGFSVYIYDETDVVGYNLQNYSFGSDIVITMTCPSTISQSHLVNLLFYSGIAGSTRNVSTSFTDIKVSTNNGNAYTTSSVVAIPGNHTLYAIWEPNIYKVTLDLNGGNGITEIYEKYLVGWYFDEDCTNKITNIPIPTREGYTFNGYIMESSGATWIHSDGSLEYGASATSVYGVVLKAQWIKN